MAYNLLVHVPYDFQGLVVSEPTVLQDDLIDITSTTDAIGNCICVFIGHLDLASIELRWLSFPMDHAEALRDLSSMGHLLVILHQVTCLVVLIEYLVQLYDLIGVLVLSHRVVEGFLANC